MGGQVNVRAGWRLFSCEECGDVRWIPTRDRYSPSSDSCIECGERVTPLENEPGNFDLDVHGNLLFYPPDRVLRRGSRRH